MLLLHDGDGDDGKKGYKQVCVVFVALNFSRFTRAQEWKTPFISKQTSFIHTHSFKHFKRKQSIEESEREREKVNVRER